MDLSAEEQLHKAMMDTYHLNLLFLSEFDNELFLRVNNLSNLIGEGEYKERFLLEFIEQSGDFDIYDSVNDCYMYKKEPKKFNNKAVLNTNFDLKNSISTLQQGFYNHENDGNFKIEGDEKIYSVAGKKFMNDLFHIKKELDYPIDRENKKISKINKFIFVGTLLGRHIPKIVKKTNAKTFLVCESNLEIFRLSLFVCDYSALAVNGNKVVFSIMDDENIFMSKFLDFFNMDVYNNSVLKFYSTNYQVDKYFDRIIDRVLSLSPMSFNYYMNLDNVVYKLSENFFKYKTIALENKLLLNSLNEKPLLYLGAGPSLSDNIEWVKKNQNKFVIVTMAAALNTLSKNNIKPDIITTLDPQIHVEVQLFSTPETEELLKNTLVLASINTHESILKRLSTITDVYLYEVLGSIQSNQNPLTGNSVGEITYSIISRFANIKSMYLLGLDLALNQDTGSTHSSDYDFNEEKDVNESSNILFSETYSYRDDFIKIKGNLVDEVLTSRLYYGSLRFYNFQTKLNKISTYNLSNHGAFIDNTIPLETNNVDINTFNDLDKDLLREGLTKDLESIVTKKLKPIDLENLELHIKLVSELVMSLQNINKMKTYEELNQLANEIFTIISNDNSNINFLREIYVTYSLAFNPYISYCMLVKEKKDKVNLKKVINIWKEKLIELLEKYRTYLEKLIIENNKHIDNFTK